MKRVAVVCAKGLGDGLISMVLSHNFFLSGFSVTTFGTPLVQLRRWFPQHHIEPFPEFSEIQKILAPYDHIIAADHSMIAQLDDPRIIVLKESTFDKTKTLVQNLAARSKTQFELKFSGTSNGIAIPNGVVSKRYAKRIVIHPEASEFAKIWPREKYLNVIQRLNQSGWQCAVCVSPEERDNWNRITEIPILLPHCKSLDELAVYIAESGYLIGNDSGPGHLASALGIPTLSIFAKKRYSRLWRPGWHKGIVAAPLGLPIGGRLRQKYWKSLLPEDKVLRAFKRLKKKEERR